MKKYIAFEVNIPDDFAENEDTFINDLVQTLKTDNLHAHSNYPNKPGVFYFPINITFTGKWEFTDNPIGM